MIVLLDVKSDHHALGTVGKPERHQGGRRMLAIGGTGYGLIGILVIILLVVLIFYFVRRA
jgi:hypothetical protein